MYLSRSGEYALRVTVEIAKRDLTKPVTSRQLSGTVHAPLSFLSKILRRLVVGGILKAAHGPSGGFLLARPPGETRLIEILEASGYSAKEGRCIFGWKRCGGSRTCPLHPSWKKVKLTFQKWAEETTLQQI